MSKEDKEFINRLVSVIHAQMAKDEGILASILFASTRSIGDKAYGTMILGIKDTEETVSRAIKYLKQMPEIDVEELA